jgi:phosphatidylinositol glycan class T
VVFTAFIMTFLCRRLRPLLSLLFLLFAFTTFTFASQPASPAAEYDESLDLTPLPPSSLLASFRFAANTSAAEFDQQNFKYFPRSLGQILQHARTKELHLRFALGRWDAESWGSRPWAGRQEGGTGVEIWAWVEADGEDE